MWEHNTRLVTIRTLDRQEFRLTRDIYGGHLKIIGKAMVR